MTATEYVSIIAKYVFFSITAMLLWDQEPRFEIAFDLTKEGTIIEKIVTINEDSGYMLSVEFRFPEHDPELRARLFGIFNSDQFYFIKDNAITISVISNDKNTINSTYNKKIDKFTKSSHDLKTIICDLSPLKLHKGEFKFIITSNLDMEKYLGVDLDGRMTGYFVLRKIYPKK